MNATNQPCPLPSDEAGQGGFQAVIDVYKKDIDRTLLRENLKLTFSERFAKFKRTMELFDELRRAGAKAREKP